MDYGIGKDGADWKNIADMVYVFLRRVFGTSKVMARVDFLLKHPRIRAFWCYLQGIQDSDLDALYRTRVTPNFTKQDKARTVPMFIELNSSRRNGQYSVNPAFPFAGTFARGLYDLPRDAVPDAYGGDVVVPAPRKVQPPKKRKAQELSDDDDEEVTARGVVSLAEPEELAEPVYGGPLIDGKDEPPASGDDELPVWIKELLDAKDDEAFGEENDENLFFQL